MSYENGRFISLSVGGNEGYVVEPVGKVDTDRRWILIAPSWLGTTDAPSYADLANPGKVEHEFYVEAALSRGFHIAGVEVGVSLGNPAGTLAFEKLHETLVKDYRLHPRARIIAQSNGALMAYNWAARHPDCMDRIFGIYPATDLRSWPGLENACGAKSWRFPAAYDMTLEELESRLVEFNPIEQLEPLAKQGVRIFHMHGSCDELVPCQANSEELVRRYRQLGGNAELRILEGIGHSPVPEFYQSERVLDFLLSRTE